MDMTNEHLEQESNRAAQGLKEMQRLLDNYSQLEWAQDPGQLKTRTQLWKPEHVKHLQQQVKQLEELKNEQQASSVGNKMLIRKK
jgi:hypothetical protein